MAGRNADDATGCGGCLGLFALLVVLALLSVALAWSVSAVGHVLDLTPTYAEIDDEGAGWIDARYENVAWGHVLTVLTLAGGVPLCVALSAELARPPARPLRAVVLAAVLIAIVGAVSLAPVGRREAPARPAS
jgi:hypothetical protein